MGIGKEEEDNGEEARGTLLLTNLSGDSHADQPLASSGQAA